MPPEPPDDFHAQLTRALKREQENMSSFQETIETMCSLQKNMTERHMRDIDTTFKLAEKVAGAYAGDIKEASNQNKVREETLFVSLDRINATLKARLKSFGESRERAYHISALLTSQAYEHSKERGRVSAPDVGDEPIIQSVRPAGLPQSPESKVSGVALGRFQDQDNVHEHGTGDGTPSDTMTKPVNRFENTTETMLEVRNATYDPTMNDQAWQSDHQQHHDGQKLSIDTLNAVANQRECEKPNVTVVPPKKRISKKELRRQKKLEKARQGEPAA